MCLVRITLYNLALRGQRSQQMIRADIRLGPTMRDVDVGYQPVQVAILQVGRSLKAGFSQNPGLPPIFCRT